MNWKELFETHILERGYDYCCDGAVVNMQVSDDIITADVMGRDIYEVEITLCDGEVIDMECSCPYALEGNNCKHMAAVLYEWSENEVQEEESEENTTNKDLFLYVETMDSYRKKVAAVSDLVKSASEEDIRSFLTDVLADDEKLLLRFYNTVNKQITKNDVKNYFRQVDNIANRYMGRDRFIDYYEASDFISELQDIIIRDVRRMIDNGSYLSAFEVMNYIFVLIGSVDIDDSDGGTSMLADDIYKLWLELLEKVNKEEKRKMYDWFTSHLDGSIIDYLQDNIEQIIVEKFEEKEYEQEKLTFIEKMISRSECKNNEWSRDYEVGKWAVRYLEILEKKNTSVEQMEELYNRYRNNSDVRRFFVGFFDKKQDYDRVLEILDESILLDKEKSRLVFEYSEKKKEIYLLQGNRGAYIDQLWQLVLEHKPGDLEIYRELKQQYNQEEWVVKREELFLRLPKNVHIEKLYKEEKLYDRLLGYVLKSPGLYALQDYADVLKSDYPEQILNKYEEEVNKMAAHSNSRKDYSYLVSLLERMKKIKDGSKRVEKIVYEWKIKYYNRRAMLDELRKLS